MLRVGWLNIIFVNVHIRSEETSDESKEDLEKVFEHVPKYHMKILLGEFNAKVDREIIFKPTNEQESLHQDSNDNGFRLVNITTSKIWWLRARCSLTGRFINTPGPPLMVRLTTRSTTYW